MKNFGEKIKHLRLKNGESQKDLANLLNISFQSISKWEGNLHYPDLLTLKKIVEHYNVDYNYFMDSNWSSKVSLEIEVAINQCDFIKVWTDFEHMGTIAPVAILDSTRHRAGDGELKHHPGPKSTFVIAVDNNNKIAFLGRHMNYSFPSCGPQSRSFYSNYRGERRNHPCFIVEQTYDCQMGKMTEKDRLADFEFVIPHGGFLVTFPCDLIEANRILTFILPEEYHFNQKTNYRDLYSNPSVGNIDQKVSRGLMIGELDEVSVYLKDYYVIFEIEKKVVFGESEYGAQVGDLLKRISDLEKIVNRLTFDISELSDRIDEIDTE